MPRPHRDLRLKKPQRKETVDILKMVAPGVPSHALRARSSLTNETQSSPGQQLFSNPEARKINAMLSGLGTSPRSLSPVDNSRDWQSEKPVDHRIASMADFNVRLASGNVTTNRPDGLRQEQARGNGKAGEVNNTKLPPFPKHVMTKLVIEKPLIQKSVIPNPVIEKPRINKQLLQKRMIKTPVVQRRLVQKPVIQKPVIPKPLVERPVIPKPVFQRPLIEKSVVPEEVLPESDIHKPVVPKRVVPRPTKRVVPTPVIVKPVISKPAAVGLAITRATLNTNMGASYGPVAQTKDFTIHKSAPGPRTSVSETMNLSADYAIRQAPLHAKARASAANNVDETLSSEQVPVKHNRGNIRRDAVLGLFPGQKQVAQADLAFIRRLVLNNAPRQRAYIWKSLQDRRTRSVGVFGVFACVLALKDIQDTKDDYEQISEMMNGVLRRGHSPAHLKENQETIQHVSSTSKTGNASPEEKCEKPMPEATKPTEKPLQFVPFELPAKKHPVAAKWFAARKLDNTPTPKRKRPALLPGDRDSLFPLDKKSKTENEAEEVDNSLGDFEEPETI
ncbi:hypothetical protein IWZ01DRAFT_554538 [Phyllosticta capitalensis]